MKRADLSDFIRHSHKGSGDVGRCYRTAAGFARKKSVRALLVPAVLAHTTPRGQRLAVERPLTAPLEEAMKHALSLGMLLALTAAAPAQDYVKERLNKSPRHHEWVEVKHGNRVVHCFVVFPETKEKATAIIVIHENKGLQDWVRGMADQLAEAGYIAIAPDLLSGMGPGGTSTKDLKSADEATMTRGKPPPAQV